MIAAPPAAEVGRSTDGYDARFAGFLTYDRKKRAFSRFDLVAFGQGWESNGNRPRLNKEGRRWVGVAFEMVDPDKPGLPPLAPPYFLFRPGNDYFGKRK